LRANDRAYPAINSNDVGQQIQIVRPRVAIAERKFTKSRCAILIVVGLGFLAHCRSARLVNARRKPSRASATFAFATATATLPASVQ
jgi:hypothetical protein